MGYTRAALRNLIGQRTGQPFFRKFGTVSAVASASGTTTTLIDSKLLREEDNYWRGSFIYFPATDELREITAFDSATYRVSWLSALTNATTSGTPYEIWSQFTPIDVHNALDSALRQAWPFFFQVAQADAITITQNTGLQYTIPTSLGVRRLAQVYLKVFENTPALVTSLGDTTQVITSTGTFSTDDVGKYITVYDNADSAIGDVRQIEEVTDSSTVVVSEDFTEALPVGAKFKIVDVSSPYVQQRLLQNWVADKPDNPTKVWVGAHLGGCEGDILTLVYEAEYSTLTADDSETDCPVDFIVNGALANLYQIKLSTAPATEVRVWDSLYKAAYESMQVYAQLNRHQHIAGTMTQHNPGSNGFPSGYPFA